MKIRNGKYKNDIGEVVDTGFANDRKVTVKLKSRETLPYDLKRKRGRPQPYVLDRERIRHLQVLDGKQENHSRILKYEDRGTCGFSLNNKNYT